MLQDNTLTMDRLSYRHNYQTVDSNDIMSVQVHKFRQVKYQPFITTPINKEMLRYMLQSVHHDMLQIFYLSWVVPFDRPWIRLFRLI